MYLCSNSTRLVPLPLRYLPLPNLYDGIERDIRFEGAVAGQYREGENCIGGYGSSATGLQ